MANKLNADDELRKEILNLPPFCGSECLTCLEDSEDIMQLIAADRKKHELQARIDENEAWYALGRMIDPREFVIEIGRLELKKQELEKL